MLSARQAHLDLVIAASDVFESSALSYLSLLRPGMYFGKNIDTEVKF